MKIEEFQRKIEAIYFDKDRKRGLGGTFMWFTEEVGELSRALRRKNQRELEGEFADCLAWLSTLASISGVELEKVAVRKYQAGCPRCKGEPCVCREPVRGE